MRAKNLSACLCLVFLLPCPKEGNCIPLGKTLTQKISRFMNSFKNPFWPASSGHYPNFALMAKFLPPHKSITLSLFLFFALFRNIILSQPCLPPPGCGPDAEYFCGEVTDFNWAMIPSGGGQYSIHVKGYSSPPIRGKVRR